MVGCMPRNEQDPAGSTQQFRAFAGGESARRGSSPFLIIGITVIVFIVAVVLVVLLAA